jgi:AraC-like DNA-binding protein
MWGPSRDDETVASAPSVTLDQVLGGVRVQGAVFLRGEYTEAWAYRSPSPEDTVQLLAPEAPRISLFHVVASGRCWCALDDGEPHWASAGDVFVLPYGDVHTMGGVEPTNEVVAMQTIIDPLPWMRMPVVRYGAGGERTDVICGYLASGDPLFDPRLRALPPLFVVSPPEGTARDWVRASIDFALQQTSPVATGGLQGPPPQLSELLVREVLKLHLASAPAEESGWLAALRDPVLAPVLAAIHGSPEQKWTVALLANEANVSPSLLDQRFREVLDLAPIRYLTGWRMHVAEELLRSTTMSIAAVARRAGYESEEAFSRAFKRARGVPPSAARLV